MSPVNARDVQGLVDATLAPGEEALEQAIWAALEQRVGKSISLEQLRSALGDADNYGWIHWSNGKVKRLA